MAVTTRSRAVRRPSSPTKSKRISTSKLREASLPGTAASPSPSPVKRVVTPKKVKNVARKTASASAVGRTNRRLDKESEASEAEDEALEQVTQEQQTQEQVAQVVKKSPGRATAFMNWLESVALPNKVEESTDSNSEEEEGFSSYESELSDNDHTTGNEEEGGTEDEGEEEIKNIKQHPRIASAINNKRKRTKSGTERKSRTINEEDRHLIRSMITETKEPAVIVSTATFKNTRRPRCPWTPSEVMYLRLGVERFGLAWSDILSCSEYHFDPTRKQMDLKDKWRNISNYRTYGSHGKRSFVIVDENHQQIIKSDTGKPYKFNNRWPRDAALKCASRDEFYKGPNKDTCLVFVREVSTDQDNVLQPIVHVYEGTRSKEVAPPHLSNLSIRSVWSSDVRKIREERYITQDDLKKLDH